MGWKTIAKISAAISLVIGVLCVIGDISGNNDYGSGALEAILFILGILGIAAGIMGFEGCKRADTDKASAKKFLTAAAVCMIPHGLIFFALFMVSRNRMFQEEEYWGGDGKETGKMGRG